MKILFIHLSDLHLKNDSQINLKIEKIISAIQIINNVDEYILVCSGDLAFSGTKFVMIYLNEIYQRRPPNAIHPEGIHA